jgi:hypothetical protein
MRDEVAHPRRVHEARELERHCVPLHHDCGIGWQNERVEDG